MDFQCYSYNRPQTQAYYFFWCSGGPSTSAGIIGLTELMAQRISVSNVTPKRLSGITLTLPNIDPRHCLWSLSPRRVVLHQSTWISDSSLVSLFSQAPDPYTGCDRLNLSKTNFISMSLSQSCVFCVLYWHILKNLTVIFGSFQSQCFFTLQDPGDFSSGLR